MVFDYINRGPDKRPLGRVGGFLQGLFSWPFRGAHFPPWSFKVLQQQVAFPPFLALNVPYGRSRWFTFRAGWRFDSNYNGYIADIILKTRELTPLFF